MIVRREIAELIKAALRASQHSGALPAFELPEPVVGQTARPEHGDYASNLALQLSKLVGMPPLRLAQAIVQHLPKDDLLSKVEIKPPGFINFTLSDAWLARQVEAILEQGERYGQIDLGRGESVQVEYGSANPTGPLHIGFGRNVVLGDTLASILGCAGYEVQREYYVNDAGTQAEYFAESLYARYAQALGVDEPVPERGYHGEYMVEWGRRLAQQSGDKYLKMPRDQALAQIAEIGLEWVLSDVRQDLEWMGIRYDAWFSERSLYESGTFEKALEWLKSRGLTEEREGALWFLATKLGGDKDEVLIRSTGRPGYFASELAYVYSKFAQRGFDWGIYVLGADHQWHAARTRLLLEALGLDPNRLRAILYQLVTVKRGGEPVRVSKRTGQLVSLREVLDEVGADAVRYFLLAHSPNSQMDFDLELAKTQSEENPVYYVQYAHARICSILRYAGDLDDRDGDVSLLRHPAELGLLRRLVRLPEIVEQAARALEPHHLAYYAQELAAAFHSFYKQCRVVSSLPEDMPLNKARLKLVRATRLVLARVLGLMGVSAPESM